MKAEPPVVAVGPASTGRRTAEPTVEAAVVIAPTKEFIAGDCQRSIANDETIKKPSPVSGAEGVKWTAAQLRIGQCSMRLREYSRAFEAFGEIRAANPREWTAAYYEGETRCIVGQYVEGMRLMRDMVSVIGTLRSDAQRALTLLSKFGIAQCDQLEYESLRQPERATDLREKFVEAYALFVDDVTRIRNSGGNFERFDAAIEEAFGRARKALVKHNAS